MYIYIYAIIRDFEKIVTSSLSVSVDRELNHIQNISMFR